MSTIKDFLRVYYHGAKRVFLGAKVKQEIIDMKKGLWQTDKWANSFMAGSDGSSVVAAALMDKEVNQYFLEGSKKDDKVLDIGCGHGVVSIFLAKNGRNMTAIDISEKLLDNLRQTTAGQNLSIEAKRGDAYNIPESDNTFDVVVARMFLQHFPDWPKVLKEMARVTKKGGKVLVHFHARENTVLGKELKQHECEFVGSDDILKKNVFSAEASQEELNRAASQAGLNLVKRNPVSFFLHNKLIGYQLGTEAHNGYMEEFNQRVKASEEVEDFVAWFDNKVMTRCSPALSYINMFTFEKN